MLNTNGKDTKDILGLERCECKEIHQILCKMEMNEIEQQLGYFNIIVLIVGFILSLFLGIVGYTLNRLLMGVNAQIVDLYARYSNNNQFIV